MRMGFFFFILFFSKPVVVCQRAVGRSSKWSLADVQFYWNFRFRISPLIFLLHFFCFQTLESWKWLSDSFCWLRFNSIVWPPYSVIAISVWFIRFGRDCVRKRYRTSYFSSLLGCCFCSPLGGVLFIYFSYLLYPVLSRLAPLFIIHFLSLFPLPTDNKNMGRSKN